MLVMAARTSARVVVGPGRQRSRQQGALRMNHHPVSTPVFCACWSWGPRWVAAMRSAVFQSGNWMRTWYQSRVEVCACSAAAGRPIYLDRVGEVGGLQSDVDGGLVQWGAGQDRQDAGRHLVCCDAVAHAARPLSPLEIELVDQ